MKVDRQIFIKQKLFQFRPQIMEKILLGVTGVRSEMLFCPNGAKSFSPALTDEIELRWVTGGTANNSEGVASGQEWDDSTPSELRELFDC